MNSFNKPKMNRFQELLIFKVFCFLGLFAGCNPPAENNTEIPGDPQIIEIHENNNPVSWDEIIQKVTLVPLETHDSAVLGLSKNIAVNDRIYFLCNNRLQLFNRDGKYLYSVGRQGRGPGEYGQITDFCITEAGDICILDYQKIMRYTASGTFQKEYSLTEYCDTCINPNFLCWINDDLQYFWISGNSEFETLPESDRFHLYKMHNGKIQQSYYKAFSVTTSGASKFVPKKDGDYYLLPSDYDNFICTIDQNGISKSYVLDFGRYHVNFEDFTYGFSSEVGYNNLMKLIQGNYGYNIHMFVDMGETIFMAFRLKAENTYGFYNKITHKTILLSSECVIDNQLPFLPLTFDRLNSEILVGVIQPYELLQYWEENDIEPSESRLMGPDDVLHLQEIEEMDNAVLVFIRIDTAKLQHR